MKELLNLLNQKGKWCTGCGACFNICPVAAISWKKDVQGFLYPYIKHDVCISCHKCEVVCPKLHPYGGNVETPTCYAARGNDDVRLVSSSGGIFTLLAQWILSEGGVVCGAAMEDDYSIHHICVEDEAGLRKLRKSKYVQSNTEYVYKEIDSYLKQGRYVLFSGCPCQVAAMINFAKNAEKLFCVDILCHGVPSQQMWQDYLSENFDLSRIQNIEFRSKLNGWRADQLRVFWKDGSSEAIPWSESAYEEGFQRNITLRNGCEDCEFAGYKRQGDLTIGDFWRVEEYDPDLNDRKGTSVILVNNAKGQYLLDQIKSRLLDIQETPLTAARFNRLDTKFLSHPQKERFKTLYPGHTFTQAVMQCRHTLYDIGLVGIYAVKNFGGHLTQYALYKTLIEQGYSVLMIECPTNSKNPPSPRGPYLFEQNPYPKYALSQYYPNIAEMKFLNKQCKTFVTGSDQMFNNNLYNNHAKFMSLNFVTDNHRKIAYAASWGHDRIWGEESDRAEESYYLKKFDFFSVREDSAVKLAKDKFGVEATHVLDPVFLCPLDEYKRMEQIGKSKIPSVPFLFAYILDPTREKEDILKKCANPTGWHIRALLDEDPENKVADIEDFWSIDTLMNTRIEVWIAHVANSELVITDSFHGMCLAILFHKEFIAVVNKKRGETRFTSLLHQLHLEERLVYSIAELPERLKRLQPIQYNLVQSTLQKEKEKSLKWLISAIEINKDTNKPMSGYDILDGRIDAICKKFDVKYDDVCQRLDQISEYSRQYETACELQKNNQNVRIMHLEENLKNLYNSSNWRVGCAVLWFPRKVRRAVLCAKDHGIAYTLKRFMQKMINAIK